MQKETESMFDQSLVSGYFLSGAFGLVGVIQIATEDLTGIGMLTIAAFSAWSTHVAKQRKVEHDKEVAQIKADTEARVKLLLAGFKCDHHACPIVGTHSIPKEFPFDRKVVSKPGEDTVDVP